jgi:hypothetical protein
MWKKLFDSNLWFSQPPIILSHTDQYLGYFFTICVVLGIIIRIAKQFAANRVKAKLLNKFFYFFLTTGVSGLIWYGLRYENVPIFSLRYWALFVLLLALIWLLLIVKYLVFKFRSEMHDYERDIVKNKYIPGSKNR